LGGFGFDARDRLVIQAGFRAHLGSRHADELDVDILDQREVFGTVKGAERDDPAEDFSHREQHAGIHDTEVVAVALGWDRRGRKTRPGSDDLHSHPVCDGDGRFHRGVHHVDELATVTCGSHRGTS
jgi:hypothetical protein